MTATRDEVRMDQVGRAASTALGGTPRAPLSARLGQAVGPRKIGAVYILIIEIVVFSIWAPQTFATWDTVKQVLDGYAITALGALALVVPLATRTFDLSFAYVMSLSGVVAAHLVATEHASMGVALIVGMAVALVIGFINAFVVVVMNIDSFIGTLATGSIVQAFITYFTNDVSITNPVLTGSFSQLGQKSIHGVILPVFYALAIAAILWFVLGYTPVGRRLYASGFNPDAAKLANIRVNRLRFCSLLVSSLIAGFAGVCLASTIASGSPTGGNGFLLPSFAAVFVGATQLKNGRFNAWGTLLAVLMLGTGSVGLNLATSAPWAVNMFTGIVLIGALAATGLRRKSANGRIRWWPFRAAKN